MRGASNVAKHNVTTYVSMILVNIILVSSLVLMNCKAGYRTVKAVKIAVARQNIR